MVVYYSTRIILVEKERLPVSRTTAQ